MEFLPPGGLPEIVFSFDTTGSMSSCLKEVRGRLQDMIQRLQADIPAIRIAVFAHGDYCDKHNYVTKWVDFSTDVKKLCDFVNNVSSTGGGDSDECYELVLRQVGEELSWTPGSNRALVMMGDANPHEPSYPDNNLNIDWREEIETLAKMGVKIYGVECHGSNLDFYKTISAKTGGHRLQLDSFSNMFDFLMAICYREQGTDLLDLYEKEVRARGDGALSKDMEGMFTSLRDGVTAPALPKAPSMKEAAKRISAAKKKLKVPTLKKIKSDFEAGKGKPKSVRKPRVKSMKKTEKVVPRLRREEVPETNFSLRDKAWSPWVKVIVPEVNDTEDKSMWRKRQGEGHGYRLKHIFKMQNDKAAFYEVAVQNARYGRRFVVFSKFCKHIRDTSSWEQSILSTSLVKAQVNKVVSQGCCVFVRRLVYRRPSNHMTFTVPSIKLYDYAWRRIRKCRTHGRLVVKQGTTISAEM